MRTHSLILPRIPRLIGAFLLMAGLGACSLIIPENPSTPRYNDVLGAPRSPQLNPASSVPAPRAAMQQAPAAPMAEAFPPVDPATDARAREIMASDVPPPPGMGEARRAPEENMQLAGGGSYPSLHAVPAAPPMGDAGAEARLARVRAQLEAERSGADAARDRLATDAAAEPSLLDLQPPAPAYPPAAPAPGPQSSATVPGVIALPPPPPPLAQSAGTPWDRGVAAPAPIMAAAPAGAAMEPIVLRAPAAAQPAPGFGYASPSPAPAASAMAPAMDGGFNPMAGGDSITLRPPTSFAGGGHYLPNSRYSTRRN